ncbi:MAG TPA: ABC transporter ATP-binding protein [Candidatus Hydrogenedentes bacterium]|nr:ABC transporter ATP-binding protein [Candidatus Hydrogenedentota bacterium]HRT20713.1 ABC transporter ATP-binding protein [Candidatus Hydrogenedentota bacterium]HRT66167.1 ABC transporter ATP-binding protein [Candidatus Hydrogenedentota bacterium]
MLPPRHVTPTPLPAPIRSILRYTRPYWRIYVAGLLLALVFVGVGLAMPVVLRLVVAEFQAGTMTQRRLVFFFFALLAMSLITGIARFFERTLIIGASRKCEYDLRNAFFAHVQTLSRDFFNRTPTGDIMARATNDLNYVRMFLGPGIMGAIDMVRLPMALALMLYLSPWLTFLSLVPLPLITLLVYLFISFIHRQSERVQAQYAAVTARAQENLAGMRVVQAYGIEDREAESFQSECMKYLRENMRLAGVMSLAWPMIGLTVALMILLVLWRGGVMVIGGQLTIEDFTGFIVCMLMLVWPLAEFGWILTLYQQGAVGMNRINEILAEQPSIADGPWTRPELTITEGGVRFEKVSFAYEGRPILDAIDFDIPAGKTVAIVGPTGSGKSTIAALFARECHPVSGRILLDGQEIQAYPLKTVRNALGYVPQDTFLFSASIRDNLCFGRPDAPRELMDAACDVAQFTETVRQLPQGYDTLLGERGVNLSGGQKQRLAIARAVIREPRIFILDDALSSVDTHTEEAILQGLKRVMAGRTSLIISHRISTIRHADLILVIDGGRIVERGTHGDLASRGGLYARMYEHQLLEEELEKA